MYKDNQDRIDAYLRGEMTADERSAFESDKNTDVALRKEYLETKAIANALADRTEKLAQMARWDMEEELRLKIQHRRMLIRRWAIGFSAAACLAIGFFTVRPMFLTTTSVPGNNFVMPNFSQETYYRGGDSSIEYLDSLINVKAYNRALAYVDSLIYDCNSELKLYEAKDSLSEKEEYNKELCEDGIEDLEWRKANLLIALGKNDEAKVCLKNLITTEGSYKEQADSLVITLK